MVEIVQYGDDRVTVLATQGTGQCQYPVLLFEILCRRGFIQYQQGWLCGLARLQ